MLSKPVGECVIAVESIVLHRSVFVESARRSPTGSWAEEMYTPWGICNVLRKLGPCAVYQRDSHRRLGSVPMIEIANTLTTNLQFAVLCTTSKLVSTRPMLTPRPWDSSAPQAASLPHFQHSCRPHCDTPTAPSPGGSSRCSRCARQASSSQTWYRDHAPS